MYHILRDGYFNKNENRISRRHKAKVTNSVNIKKTDLRRLHRGGST